MARRLCQNLFVEGYQQKSSLIENSFVAKELCSHLFMTYNRAIGLSREPPKLSSVGDHPFWTAGINEQHDKSERILKSLLISCSPQLRVIRHTLHQFLLNFDVLSCPLNICCLY